MVIFFFFRPHERCFLLLKRKLNINYFKGPGERDIIIMHHEIGYKWPSTGQSETKTVEFIQYGDTNGHTAMAKTVGFPTAIAAKMVLESMEIL